MLSKRQRLRTGRDFSVVMRGGRRVGRSDLVVHYARPAPEVDRSGPRFGLIVSTAVGNAVVRHRVSRRLRHILAELADTVDPQVDLIVRALPPAATASSDRLAGQIRSALAKAELTGSVGAR